MKINSSIDLQVSPWEVLHDNNIDEHSITKKIKIHLPENKTKIQAAYQKKKQSKEEIKQILLIFDKSRKTIKQHI